MRVAEVMSTELVTVAPDTPLKAAAQRMLEEGVSGLPVVDAAGTLVGIVTEADYLEREASRGPKGRHRLLDTLFGDRGRTLTKAEVVGDVMTKALITVEPTEPVAHAARVMVDRGVKRLPVTKDGVLVGIISRTDVLAVFARPDDEIAAEMAQLIARGLLPVAPSDVSVGVDAGTVSLEGTVETRSDAMLLADIAARLDGVIGVENNLEWRTDGRIPEQRYPGYPQEGAGGTADSSL